MDEQKAQPEITKRRVVYQIGDMDRVRIEREIIYQATDTANLTMDIYYPPDLEAGTRIPAVIFVSGYPDLGFEKILGCKLKDMGSYISWGQLVAASGLAAITYTNREPAVNIHTVLQYVRDNATSLGIAQNSIGVWACSGSVPNALSLLLGKDTSYLKCAVFCYGFMLDLAGTTIVADTAQKFGFVNPAAGKLVEDLPTTLPLFIVRAGEDQFPGLNETIDRFLAQALICNLPITFINHSVAPHAFDIIHDSEISREIMREILGFMRFHLLANP